MGKKVPAVWDPPLFQVQSRGKSKETKRSAAASLWLSPPLPLMLLLYLITLFYFLLKHLLSAGMILSMCNLFSTCLPPLENKCYQSSITAVSHCGQGSTMHWLPGAWPLPNTWNENWGKEGTPEENQSIICKRKLTGMVC